MIKADIPQDIREYKEQFFFGLNFRQLICAVLISSAGVLLKVPLMCIFTSDPEVIAVGETVLIINLLLELGRTTNLVLIACLRASGDVYFPTACAIFSNWAISVAGAYLLAVVFNFGICGLWVALALDECIRGVMMIFRWKNGKWRTKSLTAKEAVVD